MRKKQFSSYFEEKVKLRVDFLPSKKSVLVLDAFHGPGKIWDAVKARRPDQDIVIFEIDREPHKKSTVKGDNLKYLKGLDLSRFDVIDLDAFGCVFPQLELVFQAGYHGRVFITQIQVAQGRLSSGLFYANGISPDMLKQCPTLFRCKGFDFMINYLANHGVAQVSYYFIQGQGLKLYLTFEV